MSDWTRLPSLGARGEGWFHIQVVFLAIAIGAGVFGEGWPALGRVPRFVAAILLGAAGTSLAAAGIGSLGHSITPMPRPHQHAELKQTGPYASVRHPIYGGLLLVALAWSLIMSPWALIPSGVLAIFFALKARLEEHWLAERFPEYADYARRVRRRFVPYLW